MKLKILLLTFKSKNEIKEDPSKIRGFFAKKFNEYVLLHQHLGNKFIYKYPLIQYKVINKEPILLGINEGMEVLKKIFDKYHILELDNKKYEILERSLLIKEQEFRVSKNFIKYKFLTPWLALNEKNYKEYSKLFSLNSLNRSKCSSPLNGSSSSSFLNKILVGNILSISKSLGYVVIDEIKVESNLRPIKTKLKGVPFIGFIGNFKVNFEIPDYFGIGKSVSRGFGTVIHWFNGSSSSKSLWKKNES